MTTGEKCSMIKKNPIRILHETRHSCGVALQVKPSGYRRVLNVLKWSSLDIL